MFHFAIILTVLITTGVITFDARITRSKNLQYNHPHFSPAKDTTRSNNLPTEACKMVGGMTQRQRAVCAESPALVPVMLEVSGDRQIMHRVNLI